MKRFAFIAAVVFTTLTLQSCRQSDEVFSPEEAATLQKVRDSSNVLIQLNNGGTFNSQQSGDVESIVDGELLPPPKK